MSHSSKIDLAASLTTCATGLTANYPATESWALAGTTYKRGDLLNMLQVVITAVQTTQADHATWIASAEAEKAKLATLQPVLAALKKTFEAEWGATSTKMAEFGFDPAKPPTKTAASKAAAAAKGRATRAAKKAALAALGTAAAPAPTAATPSTTAPATAPVPPKTT